MFRYGTIALIGYSNELSNMADADKLYRGYDPPHNDQLIPDTVLAFGGG